MANNGVLRRNLLKNLSLIISSRRVLNTASSSSSSSFNLITENEKPISVIERPIVFPDTERVLDFHDTNRLLSSLSTARLLKSSATLHAAAVEPLVDFGIWVMTSRLMNHAASKKVVMEVVKHTFYHHFCAGQDLEEVSRTVSNLQGSGLKAMLDYGLEHVEDNESCDQNFLEFLHTIESTKSLPPSSVSFIVVKITAICPTRLLQRVSDLLRWEYRENNNNKSFIKLPWKLQSLPVLTDSSPLYHTPEKPEALTPDEERDLSLAHARLETICERCMEVGVPLLVDAEDTRIQPAIDYFTYSAAVKYQKDDDAVVFGTVQAYLKDAKDRLVTAQMAAEKLGVPMGFKLVRGAYMSSEREWAHKLSVESPVQDTIEETHSSYDDCAAFMLDRVANGSGAVVLATHNIESGKLAARKAMDLGIRKDKEKLQFAQLYGMAEVLSFGLRNAGFRVSKYLPFGPVEQIMPYLIRRAEENRGLLSASSIDRKLMRKELMRRFKSVIV